MSSSFEDLVVWKKACRLAVKLYDLLKDSRDYGLRDNVKEISKMLQALGDSLN